METCERKIAEHAYETCIGEKRHKHSQHSRTEMKQMSVDIKHNIYSLSLLIGNRQKSMNKYGGAIGLALWVANMIIHFSLDFYEAAYVFHTSWCSCVIVWFLWFLIATISLTRCTITWFIGFIRLLSKHDIYYSTLKRLHLLFKFSPVAMTVFSLSGAAGQYGCYAYDGALTLHIYRQSKYNATDLNTIVSSLNTVVNIVRFTSLVHIYYFLFLLLFIIAVVFYSIIQSQKQFNTYIGTVLTAHPPSITFKEAVHEFNSRAKTLHNASANTTIVLSTLLLTTSVSFVINVYNFLFIKRFAVYVWFAVAPLIWNISPLIGAAMVTCCYQDLKLIAMQSWVQVPEEYDEIWDELNGNNKQVDVDREKLVGEVNSTREMLRERERKNCFANFHNEPSDVTISTTADTSDTQKRQAVTLRYTEENQMNIDHLSEENKQIMEDSLFNQNKRNTSSYKHVISNVVRTDLSTDPSIKIISSKSNDTGRTDIDMKCCKQREALALQLDECENAGRQSSKSSKVVTLQSRGSSEKGEHLFFSSESVMSNIVQSINNEHDIQSYEIIEISDVTSLQSANREYDRQLYSPSELDKQLHLIDEIIIPQSIDNKLNKELYKSIGIVTRQTTTSEQRRRLHSPSEFITLQSAHNEPHNKLYKPNAIITMQATNNVDDRQLHSPIEIITLQSTHSELDKELYNPKEIIITQSTYSQQSPPPREIITLQLIDNEVDKQLCNHNGIIATRLTNDEPNIQSYQPSEVITFQSESNEPDKQLYKATDTVEIQSTSNEPHKQPHKPIEVVKSLSSNESDKRLYLFNDVVTSQTSHNEIYKQPSVPSDVTTLQSINNESPYKYSGIITSLSSNNESCKQVYMPSDVITSQSTNIEICEQSYNYRVGDDTLQSESCNRLDSDAFQSCEENGSETDDAKISKIYVGSYLQSLSDSDDSEDSDEFSDISNTVDNTVVQTLLDISDNDLASSVICSNNTTTKTNAFNSTKFRSFVNRVNMVERGLNENLKVKDDPKNYLKAKENCVNSSNSNKFRSILRAVQAVKRIKRIHRKFNFEKYISFLQYTLEHTGYSIGMVTITWDRVSFIMVLLFTLVSVFAQNVFL